MASSPISRFAILEIKTQDKKSPAIAFMDGAGMGSYVLPEGAQTFQKDLLDRIHTRITRLNGLVEQNQSH